MMGTSLCFGTAELLRGPDQKTYPFMGLSEIGNVKVRHPRDARFLNAWPASLVDDIHITYAQAYAPLVKPFDGSSPFHDHPYLLCMLLGRDYVR